MLFCAANSKSTGFGNFFSTSLKDSCIRSILLTALSILSLYLGASSIEIEPTASANSASVRSFIEVNISTNTSVLLVSRIV